MLRGIGKDMPNDWKTGSIARIWSLFRGYNGACFSMKWSLFSGAAEHLFKVSGEILKKYLYLCTQKR